MRIGPDDSLAECNRLCYTDHACRTQVTNRVPAIVEAPARSELFDAVHERVGPGTPAAHARHSCSPDPPHAVAARCPQYRGDDGSGALQHRRCTIRLTVGTGCAGRCLAGLPALDA